MVCSFVYKELNKVLRLRLAGAKELAPFARGLHDLLSQRGGSGLPEFKGNTYRVMTLDAATVERYAPDAVYKRNNFMSWDSFTSATCEPAAAWANIFAFGANTLFVIMHEEGQAPVRVDGVSDIANEAEVMYPLGQQFRKLKVKKMRLADVRKTVLRLSPEAHRRDDDEVAVVWLQAVDAFWDFADDLFADGGTADAAIPILKVTVYTLL